MKRGLILRENLLLILVINMVLMLAEDLVAAVLVDDFIVLLAVVGSTKQENDWHVDIALNRRTDLEMNRAVDRDETMTLALYSAFFNNRLNQQSLRLKYLLFELFIFVDDR